MVAAAQNRNLWHTPGAREATTPGPRQNGVPVIILGIILIILGAVFDIGLLWTIGAILAIVGAVLWILGSMGRAVGPRTHYW